jgi:hypothetical protein
VPCYVIGWRGAKRIEAVRGPEAAATVTDLRKRTGSTYSAIIEGLLLAEHARGLQEGRVRACIRKGRVGKGFRWVLDYRDQQGLRHWKTTEGNRKEAERPLAARSGC